LRSYADPVAGHVLPLLTATTGDDSGRDPELGSVLFPAIDPMTLTFEGALHLDGLAAGFLAAVKAALRAGVRVFEQDGDAALTGDRDGLRSAGAGVAAAVAELRAVGRAEPRRRATRSTTDPCWSVR
jgi:hypothetical protein